MAGAARACLRAQQQTRLRENEVDVWVQKSNYIKFATKDTNVHIVIENICRRKAYFGDPAKLSKLSHGFYCEAMLICIIKS